MKYTINVNQAGADAANLRGKVDIIDLAIFDAFKEFANGTKCEKKIGADGRIWFWISYKLIIEEIPYCNINTNDGIYRRMKNLQAAGIIDFHHDNQRIGKTFFTWGTAYDLLISDSDLRIKNRRGTDQKPEGVRIKNRTIIILLIIVLNQRKKKQKTLRFPLPPGLKTFPSKPKIKT